MSLLRREKGVHTAVKTGVTASHRCKHDALPTGEEVVRDGNWVSSRQPSDIPAFTRELLALLSEHRGQGRTLGST